MLPPAPMRFSTITCCCQSSDHLSAMSRAVKSAAPPGVKVTMMCTGFVGYALCAEQMLARSEMSSAKPKRMAAGQCYPTRAEEESSFAYRFEGVRRRADFLRSARKRRQLSEQA